MRCHDHQATELQLCGSRADGNDGAIGYLAASLRPTSRDIFTSEPRDVLWVGLQVVSELPLPAATVRLTERWGPANRYTRPIGKRLSRVGSPGQVGRHDQLRLEGRQLLGRQSRLRAPDVVEGNIGLALEPSGVIPLGAPVPPQHNSAPHSPRRELDAQRVTSAATPSGIVGQSAQRRSRE